MSEHTKAPWTIIPAVVYDGDDDDLCGSYTSPAGIEGDDGNPVCVFGSLEGSGCLFENEADYALIAAAPDLLALVIQYRDDLKRPPSGDSIYRRMAAIDAAIAKATI